MLLTGVALLLLLPPARAQEPPKPGKELDYLKRLVGTWDAETQSGTGTMTWKMGLGGQWLIGDFDGEFGGMQFQSKSLDTYDPATKKYRSISVASLSTAPRIMEGNLDKDNRVMTMTGEGPIQQGATARFKSITEFKDANTVNFTLFVVDKDGKEQAIVKITYKRKSQTARRRSSFPGVQGRATDEVRPLSRSADLQSAVSQVCNLQAPRTGLIPRNSGRLRIGDVRTLQTCATLKSNPKEQI
jgi:hypothetical protein